MLAVQKAYELYNFLGINTMAKNVGAFFDEHKTIYKLVIIADHFFRSIAMYALMNFLPFTMTTNMALCLGGSLLYVFSAERFCSAFKFSLASNLGAMSFHYFHKWQALALISKGIAEQSFQVFGLGILRALPLAYYLVYVIQVSNRNVEDTTWIPNPKY